MKLVTFSARNTVMLSISSVSDVNRLVSTKQAVAMSARARIRSSPAMASPFRNVTRLCCSSSCLMATLGSPGASRHTRVGVRPWSCDGATAKWGVSTSTTARPLLSRPGRKQHEGDYSTTHVRTSWKNSLRKSDTPAHATSHATIT